MSTSTACRACATRSVAPRLDFGPQPPSNRFERPEVREQLVHALVLGQCVACGLLQLVDPMPAVEAKSRFAWITYNEPEGHLDDLVTQLAKLPGLGPASRLAGLTYKDDSSLARFSRLGFANTFRYDPAGDLGLADPCAGLESVQAALDDARAVKLAEKHGRADLLLARHILEHAHDPAAFLRALAKLVKPGGYLAFEMPDCTKFVRACDHSFVWEEHIAYFSGSTLRALLHRAGLHVHTTRAYPYPLEDSLIAVARNSAPAGDARSASSEVQQMLADGERFAAAYPALRERLRELLRGWRVQGKKVGIFGAGHLAAKFVNLYGLAPLVECVIDDNTSKQALVMPGSRLPIRGSAALAGIDVCLLSLNPESEPKVLAKQQAYIERGGEFLSIFALSSKAVHKVAA